MTEDGCGRLSAAVVETMDVMYPNASLRWVSFLAENSERLWLNSAAESLPPSVKLCCFKMMAAWSLAICARAPNTSDHIHFAAKLVSVALVFFGRLLPTFSFVFEKSFAFSFFFFDEAPISAIDAVQIRQHSSTMGRRSLLIYSAG